MAWTAWLWTAVIPSVPLVVPALNWVLLSAGVLLLVSAVALLLERDVHAGDVEQPSALHERALGCAA